MTQGYRHLSGPLFVMPLTIALFVAIVSMLYTPYSHSNPNSLTNPLSSVAAVDPSSETKKLWAASAIFGYSQLLYDDPTTLDHQPFGDLSVAISYQGFSKTSLLVSTFISQDITGGNHSQGGLNIRASQKAPIYQDNHWQYLIGGSLGLPMGTTAQSSSLLATTSFHNIFAISALAPVNTFVSWTLTKYLFEYETSKSGAINPSFASRLSTTFTYSLDKYLLSGTIGYRNRLSMQNTWRENIFHSQSLTLALSDKSSLTLGHSWGDNLTSIFKANGQDLEISFMDEQNSSVFIQLEITI